MTLFVSFNIIFPEMRIQPVKVLIRLGTMAILSGVLNIITEETRSLVSMTSRGAPEPNSKQVTRCAGTKPGRLHTPWTKKTRTKRKIWYAFLVSGMNGNKN